MTNDNSWKTPAWKSRGPASPPRPAGPSAAQGVRFSSTLSSDSEAAPLQLARIEGLVWTKDCSFVFSSSEPLVISTAIIWVLCWQFGERRKERDQRCSPYFTGKKTKRNNKQMPVAGDSRSQGREQEWRSLFLPAKSPLVFLACYSWQPVAERCLRAHEEGLGRHVVRVCDPRKIN